MTERANDALRTDVPELWWQALMGEAEGEVLERLETDPEFRRWRARALPALMLLDASLRERQTTEKGSPGPWPTADPLRRDQHQRRRRLTLLAVAAGVLVVLIALPWVGSHRGEETPLAQGAVVVPPILPDSPTLSPGAIGQLHVTAWQMPSRIAAPQRLTDLTDAAHAVNRSAVALTGADGESYWINVWIGQVGDRSWAGFVQVGYALTEMDSARSGIAFEISRDESGGLDLAVARLDGDSSWALQDWDPDGDNHFRTVPSIPGLATLGVHMRLRLGVSGTAGTVPVEAEVDRYAAFAVAAGGLVPRENTAFLVLPDDADRGDGPSNARVLLDRAAAVVHLEGMRGSYTVWLARQSAAEWQAWIPISDDQGHFVSLSYDSEGGRYYNDHCTTGELDPYRECRAERSTGGPRLPGTTESEPSALLDLVAMTGQRLSASVEPVTILMDDPCPGDFDSATDPVIPQTSCVERDDCEAVAPVYTHGAHGHRIRARVSCVDGECMMYPDTDQDGIPDNCDPVED